MAKDEFWTKVCIIGSGPAGHTAAVYTSRAELHPIMFEGWMANGVAAGGQLTTTTDIENFPGFPEGVMGWDLTQKFRQQSVRFGTQIYSETVERVDFSKRPFKVETDKKIVEAETVIISTGAVARRLDFPGSGEDGYWQKGISACAVCDGAMPIFRRKRIAVIGGGDSAMEEALYMTKFASKVYIIHRRDELRASKIMVKRATSNEKIEFIWSHTVVGASGNDQGRLGSITIASTKTGERRELEVNGLFFAIGHEPASKFLGGQVDLDEAGYIVTHPGSTATSVPGVFAAGDVQDKKWRQAITAAGTDVDAFQCSRSLSGEILGFTPCIILTPGATALPGCMAALEAEYFIQDYGLTRPELPTAISGSSAEMQQANGDVDQAESTKII